MPQNRPPPHGRDHGVELDAGLDALVDQRRVAGPQQWVVEGMRIGRAALGGKTHGEFMRLVPHPDVVQHFGAQRCWSGAARW
jgi:hypothetical protein